MHRHYEQVMGVYFDDLDPFRILHNARYLLLFERTLGSFWQHVGLGGFDADVEDHSHLVRSNTIDYLRPVRGTGEVRVRLWIETIGRTSLTIGFRLMPLDQDLDFAVGRRTVVCVDPKTQQAVPWSAGFRERMAPWVAG